jgi:heme-degrading monooxygenase HmoA
MVVAFSRFKVINGYEGAVREAFLNRPGLVDNVAGFLGLEVFSDTKDAAAFYLITRWTDADSFHRWHSGPDHEAAHLGIPKGLKLDASFTLVRTLERIDGEGELFRSDGARDSASLLSGFLHGSAGVYWVKAGSDGKILAHNEAFLRRFGPEGLHGANIWPLLTDADAASLRQAVDAGKRDLAREYRLNFVDSERQPVTLACHIDVQPAWFELIGESISQDEMSLQRELMGLNGELAVQLRENDRKSKALRQSKAALEKALFDLLEAQRHLANLQDVIPICMICGKVKNSDSKWEDVLSYFQRNNLQLSHGYCPDCGEKEIDKLAL